MFWRDKYGSIIKEKAQGPLRQERKGREVKIHHCFSSSFDVAFCFFFPILLPPFSSILGKAKLLIGLISTLLFLREKEGLKRGRKIGESFLSGQSLEQSEQILIWTWVVQPSTITTVTSEITIIHRIIMKMSEVLQELSKCDRNEWKNAFGKMAPIDLLDRVATNIHFVKNAIFAKHNKMQK